MACNEEWLEILSAWHDGEATSEEIARAEAHVPQCASCQAARRRFQLVRVALRSVHLRPGADRTTFRKEPLRQRRGRRRLLAGMLAAAAIVLLLVPGWSYRQSRTAVFDELEARHLTAFAKAVPCDFESADPEAVRRWISEQLGHDVQVPVVPGAKLLGARRCRLSNKPTVALMYRHGEEPLSLFLPPAGTWTEMETGRLARASTRCTVGRLGVAVCARPGLVAVAETTGSALAGVSSF